VGPRRELGVRTCFNLLGPLTNPARPEAQLVGVPRPELAPFMARCLARLGVRRAWVVHGAGLDEISLSGPTTVAALADGAVTTFTVEPEHGGLPRCAQGALEGAGVEACAAIARSVLGGDPGPCRDVVILNAAASLVVAGRARGLGEGAALAASVLDDGRALRVLERAREVLAG